MVGARIAFLLARAIGVTTLAARAGVLATTAYLDVLALAAFRAQRSAPQAGREPRLRLAVLVPAHDEEKLIGALVDGFRAQEFPEHLFRLHVVADNCTDDTADIAKRAGAEVHVRVDPDHPGKGPALEWLLARLAADGDDKDAYVFVDADTIVDRRFLLEIERSLVDGADIVQGHYAVLPDADAPVVALRAAAMALRNYLRPLGRSAIGGSAGLYGNGMAFRTEVMGERRWSDHLTEDAELALELLLDGELVSFARDAVVRAEMPATIEASQTQHERWERGRIQLAQRFLPRLVWRSVRGGRAPRVAFADAAFDVVVPPLSVLVAATGGWGLVAAGRWAVGRRSPTELAVVGVVAAGQVAAVLAALRLVRAPAAVYRSLLLAPRMIIWKVGLWARVIVRPRRGPWIRTARN